MYKQVKHEIERQKTATIHEQTQSFTVCGTQQLTHKPAFSEARPQRSVTTVGPPLLQKPRAPLQKTGSSTVKEETDFSKKYTSKISS